MSRQGGYNDSQLLKRRQGRQFYVKRKGRWVKRYRWKNARR